MVNRQALVLIALLTSSAAVAQVGTTVKQGSKAVAQTVQQLGDQAKAAVSSEPGKSIDKTKAMAHKAKAHYHAKRARHAAKKIPK
jgi:hypothetical protein